MMVRRFVCSKAANRSVVELDPGKYPDIDGNMIVFNRYTCAGLSAAVQSSATSLFGLCSIAAGKVFIEKHGFADLEDELLFVAHTIFRRGQYMAASGVAKYSLLMDISGGGKVILACNHIQHKPGKGNIGIPWCAWNGAAGRCTRRRRLRSSECAKSWNSSRRSTEGWPRALWSIPRARRSWSCTRF